MSMILDALRKSDRQRTRHASDRLREGPRLAKTPDFSGRALALFAAGLLLAATAIFVAIRPEQVPTPRAASAQDTGETGENMENRRPAAPVRSLAGELVRETAAPAMPTETAEAETPVAPAEDDELTAPPIETLPVIRQQLPELRVDIHAWANDPGERFVLINLRRYGEGDRLQEGPLLRRINRDGVVLEFEGTLFSLPRQ